MRYYWLKRVKIYNGYVFFPTGDVFSLYSMKFLSACNSYKGKLRYKTIKISGKTKYVHQLIAWLFKGLVSSSKWVINHIDGDKLNNCVSNLELIPQWLNVKLAKIGVR